MTALATVNKAFALGWRFEAAHPNYTRLAMPGGVKFGPVAWPNPEEFIDAFVEHVTHLVTAGHAAKAESEEQRFLLACASRLWWDDVGARGHYLAPDVLGWARCRDFGPNVGRGSSTAISHGLRALYERGLVERRPLHERLRPVFEYRGAPEFEKPFVVPDFGQACEFVVDTVVKRRRKLAK